MKPVRLLHVEDNPQHARIFSRTVDKIDCNILLNQVDDGEKAIQFLKREGEFANESQVDLILLDINLPKLSGIEVAQVVKSQPELKRIPIVILTTSEAEKDRREAYNAGVNSYLVKPIDFKLYEKVILDLCNYWINLNKY